MLGHLLDGAGVAVDGVDQHNIIVSSPAVLKSKIALVAQKVDGGIKIT